MNNTKKLGVWLDHSSAHMMEYKDSIEGIKTINSEYTEPVKQERGLHSEHLLHSKENQAQQFYYKKLIEAIKDYDEVLLFGPTNAKSELYNLIKADRRLEKLNIETKATDKMTNTEMLIFTNKHFSQSV
jgi:stalled ribosome rescue protein Dom34